MISEAGINRVLTVDLHADQIQGFFDIPVDNVYSSPVLLGDLWRQKYDDLVVVSPDVGGVVRARAIAKRMDDADLAIIDKRRPRANVSEVMNIIGEVEGKSLRAHRRHGGYGGHAVPGGAGALKEHGAESVAGLRHPRRAVGPGRGAHRGLARSTNWW